LGRYGIIWSNEVFIAGYILETIKKYHVTLWTQDHENNYVVNAPFDKTNVKFIRSSLYNLLYLWPDLHALVWWTRRTWWKMVLKHFNTTTILSNEFQRHVIFFLHNVRFNDRQQLVCDCWHLHNWNGQQRNIPYVFRRFLLFCSNYWKQYFRCFHPWYVWRRYNTWIRKEEYVWWIVKWN